MWSKTAVGVAEDEVDAAFDVGVDVVLAAVVGEESVLMAEEAAVFEDAAVGAVGYGDSLSGVAGGVFEGEVVGFEAGAVDLYGFGEEGAAGLFRIERVGDDDVFGGFAFAEEGDVGVVLGDDDALVIGAGGDLDVDAATGTGPRVMVHGVLNGGEDGAVFVAGCGGWGGGVDADVDVLGVGEDGKQDRGKQQACAHES